MGWPSLFVLAYLFLWELYSSQDVSYQEQGSDDEGTKFMEARAIARYFLSASKGLDKRHYRRRKKS
jgi:hypothetical protein